MVESAISSPGLAPHTRRLIVIGVVVTYLLGLMARVPVYDDILVGAAFSLVMDTVLLSLLFVFLSFVAKSRSVVISAYSFLLTIAASGVSALVILGVAWSIRQVFPSVANNYQARPLVIFAYVTLFFFIWGMTALWMKTQTRLAQEALAAANAERAAAVSELRRLRMQLDPHFLFNALNTALVEVTQKPKRAVLMLRELSGYLRYSLDTADTHFVPVAAELAMIRMFLRIQDIRFGAKLKYEIAAEDAAKRRLIPTFLLQPLIENAVKYGLPDDDNVLRVKAAVALRDGDLIITVSNTGDLTLARPDREGTGSGLNNLRGRLALHYPGRHVFEMEQIDQTVRVTCVLKGEPC